jgi:predicted Zn-dependent peptidase
MPKLPDNYVTAPKFDNPLRATAPKSEALAERRLMLRVDKLTWDILQAAAEREHTTPEELVQRALDRYLLNEQPSVQAVQPVAMAPRATDVPRPGLRAQLMARLQERLMHSGLFQRLLSVRDVLSERRV